MRQRLLPLLVASLFLPACDDAPPAPPPPPEVKKPDAPARPTTQAILEGPRKTLPLQVIPFTLSVPESWELKTRGESITMLEGPAVGTDAIMTLDILESVSGEIMKLWFERAAKEAKENREGLRVSIRDFGSVRGIERLRLPANPKAADGEPARVEWRLTLFVPSGLKHEVFEMRWFDLSIDALRENEQLLTDILRTVKYDLEANAMPPRP